tara:strand:- start:5 stop:157 length:153 start_codon:yes stop_codon:yes gene_type:complete
MVKKKTTMKARGGKMKMASRKMRGGMTKKMRGGGAMKMARRMRGGMTKKK